MSIDMKIGEKAKQLRQEQNITLKELSEKTNLSVGYLSQFERGINTIALDSLEKIAEVYDVDLNYFFPNKKRASSIILKKHERNILDILGENYVATCLCSDDKEHIIYPRMIEILPSFKKEELQTYPHEGEEFIYVLEGILTLLYDNEKHYLYPGDTAHYYSNVPHNWANDTNMNVKLLCMSVPNPFNKANKGLDLDKDHLVLSQEDNGNL